MALTPILIQLPVKIKVDADDGLIGVLVAVLVFVWVRVLVGVLVVVLVLVIVLVLVAVGRAAAATPRLTGIFLMIVSPTPAVIVTISLATVVPDIVTVQDAPGANDAPHVLRKIKAVPETTIDAIGKSALEVLVNKICGVSPGRVNSTAVRDKSST